MIRSIQDKDINKVMDIWLRSTIKAHDFILKEYWDNSYNTVKDVYIPMADTFIYEDEESIKGFISIINNEFIGALFVDTDSQGGGIGKKLINFAIDKYKNLSLAVYKDNVKSVVFYKRMGFTVVKEQVNQDSGYTEYIMQKI
ncbi:N-acetyltransferase [Asaccharospora irregularis]|uniref:Putative acetyltransferase n=1 Tax=Asaccharospora irregularis DSM 2635 TaxID=1121321 RepID=A0A1M5TC02_9FIRM|nr:N-acetyltransferase [Asaccharospora irregularis]SHH48234.1 putative acetyltransferase [Asaccharospora irregularis DSM 2635]